MKTKQLLMVSLIMLLCCGGYAQSEKTKYYFVTTKDTVFCKSLSYGTNMQGYLNMLDYVDLAGTKTVLKGKKDVPEVMTIHLDTVTFDKIPQKPDKPDSYITYCRRVVDGKLKVYLQQQGSRTTTHTEYSSAPLGYARNSSVSSPAPGIVENSVAREGPSGSYRFFLKMPNGTYYRINDKDNIKNFIKPYLLKCKEFENTYKGDFGTKETPFMEMITLYNSLCK